MNTISLSIGPNCWLAKFSGERAAEIAAIMRAPLADDGTISLPCGFTPNAPPWTVLAAIQKLNPDVEVRFEPNFDLDALVRTAETGEQWAEICLMEAEKNGGPFYEKEPS